MTTGSIILITDVLTYKQNNYNHYITHTQTDSDNIHELREYSKAMVKTTCQWISVMVWIIWL